MLDKGKRNLSPDLMAAFIVSPNGFTATSNSCEHDDPLDDTILYVSGIVILSKCNGIIYDVLYDFMAINAVERGAKFIRVEVDLKASNDLNTNLASHLANDEDSDYRLVDSDSKSAYFEAKLSDFEEEYNFYTMRRFFKLFINLDELHVGGDESLLKAELERDVSDALELI